MNQHATIIRSRTVRERLQEMLGSMSQEARSDVYAVLEAQQRREPDLTFLRVGAGQSFTATADLVWLSSMTEVPQITSTQCQHRGSQNGFWIALRETRQDRETHHDIRHNEGLSLGYVVEQFHYFSKLQPHFEEISSHLTSIAHSLRLMQDVAAHANPNATIYELLVHDPVELSWREGCIHIQHGARGAPPADAIAFSVNADEAAAVLLPGELRVDNKIGMVILDK